MWPEEGIFGTIGIPTDEELSMLETVYNTDLGVEIGTFYIDKNMVKILQNTF